MCCSSILLHRILQKSDRYIFYANSEVLFLSSKHMHWFCLSFLVLLSALVKEAFYHWQDLELLQVGFLQLLAR